MEIRAERSVGRRAARRRSIEPERIQALGRIVNGFKESTGFWLGTGVHPRALTTEIAKHSAGI